MKLLKINFSLILTLLFSCTNMNNSKIKEKTIIEDKINQMIYEDQKMQNLVVHNKDISKIQEIESKKKKVIEKNCKECEKILKTYGYPNYNIVSKKSSYNYWILIQHCDNFLNLQKSALIALEIAVKEGIADKSNYAYLKDRVCVNMNEPQIYGTQVYKNSDNKYVLYPIKDISTVNERRKECNINNSIEDYLIIMNSF